MTAELALAIPALLVVLALVMWALSAIGMKIQVVDVAHHAALAASRGDDPQAAVAAQRPDGATVSTSDDGNYVSVTVTASVKPLGPLAPSRQVTATAQAIKQDLR